MALKMKQLANPVRTSAASAYTGCTKRRSHRLLVENQQLEIPYAFPKFPQIFGEWIVRRIRRKEAGKDHDHPCSKTLDTYLDCVRRCPDTFEKKCAAEAGKCLACLEEHRTWRAPQPHNYMRFLEYFRVFSEGSQTKDAGPGKFNYKKPSPDVSGQGLVMKLQRPAQTGTQQSKR